MTILTLTTGSAFIMWLGEQISERGIGNGMVADHLHRYRRGPASCGPRDLYEKAVTRAWGPFTPIALIFLVALMIAVVAFIVFVEGAQRRNPGAVCQARCRPSRDGRAIFVLAAPRQFRGRDSPDFRQFAAGVSADHCAAVQSQVSVY